MCKGEWLAEGNGGRLAELDEVGLQWRHSTAMQEEWVDAGGALPPLGPRSGMGVWADTRSGPHVNPGQARPKIPEPHAN